MVNPAIKDEIEIRPYRMEDEAQVIHLWHCCGLVVPWNDPQTDIQLKLQTQPDLFLVGAMQSQVIATLMAGYEGHRGWLNYLAVAPEYQRRGIGRLMVQRAIDQLKAMNCPKINLQIRASNTTVVDFYRRLGFTIDEVISMGKRL